LFSKIPIQEQTGSGDNTFFHKIIAPKISATMEAIKITILAAAKSADREKASGAIKSDIVNKYSSAKFYETRVDDFGILTHWTTQEK
jgi:hypothetical protein